MKYVSYNGFLQKVSYIFDSLDDAPKNREFIAHGRLIAGRNSSYVSAPYVSLFNSAGGFFAVK